MGRLGCFRKLTPPPPSLPPHPLGTKFTVRKYIKQLHAIILSSMNRSPNHLYINLIHLLSFDIAKYICEFIVKVDHAFFNKVSNIFVFPKNA